jgi:hypothetical protein
LRTTRAAAALERLKERSQEAGYSMTHLSDGRFALTLDGSRIGEPLELDHFVAFVNAIAKGPPKRVSKFEREFDEKLARSREKQKGPGQGKP